MPPPMAVRLAADLRPSVDASAVRTSLVAGQLAGSQRAYSLGWDRQTYRQTDRRTDRGMAEMSPDSGGIIAPTPSTE